jgi:hypothetical protein
LYLCSPCQRELRDACGQLLPNGYRGGGFIEWLQDEALGNTRKGESARRSTEKGSPMMHNEHASTLLTQLHAMLTTWVSHLCGTEVSTTSTTTAAAIWLANNIPTIACNEAAGEIFAQVRKAIDDIERMINRPIPPRFLGPCPIWVSASHDKKCQKIHPHACTTALIAKVGLTEVTCPQCHTVHDVERLLEQQLRDTDDKSFTMSELWKLILPVMRLYVPLRTLQHWAARGQMIPTGYDIQGEPKFLLHDVRELWIARPQQGATGAAAHKIRGV